ncbi:hypothetical protein J7444_08180 [Labrenzia sp. R4_1]|uniref:hypothetical protein n=1 Tax=Labrenzia sp. R4_1 TaxID=2821106 RepID=UPI001ADD3154|nr:hypothetical protein [Labrenzia sp. R4_1]MBO9424695.1 hypothetical protein [Labrenzia sp. R4_1]
MTTPIPSNGYPLSPGHVTKQELQGNLHNIHGRLVDLKADLAVTLQSLGDDALSGAVTYVADSIAPQLTQLTQNIAGLEAEIATAQDALTLLQNGGIAGENVALTTIDGLTADDVQAALAELLQIIGGINALPIPGGQMEGPIGFSDDQTFPLPAKEFTAAGAISAGDPVALNDDETVSAVGSTAVAADVGTPVQLSTSVVDHIRIAYDTANSRVVIVYRNLSAGSVPYSIVGTVSGTSISFGTPVAVGTIAHNLEAHDALVYVPSLGKLLVCYAYNNSLRAAVGTVSGTSITWGAENTINLPETVSRSRLVYDDKTDTVIILYDQTTSDDLYAAILSISGDTVSMGAPFLINESGADNWIWAAAGNGMVFVIYEAASNDSFTSLIKIDGATLKKTTENFSAFEAWGWASAGYTNFNTESGMIWHPIERCFVMFWVRGKDMYACCIYPNADGTAFDITRPFPIGSEGWADPTQYSLWPCYNPTTNRISVVYQGATPLYATSLEVKVENGVVSEDARTILNAEDSSHCAGVFDPDSGNVICAYWNITDSQRAKALVFTAPATYSNARNFIGLAAGDISSGQTVLVDIPGGSNANQAGLTPNLEYFLSDDGSLTTGRTLNKVGKALSATEILIGGEA